jgi:ABC-type branched-subunit amino acid transport system substrate-binding protein
MQLRHVLWAGLFVMLLAVILLAIALSLKGPPKDGPGLVGPINDVRSKSATTGDISPGVTDHEVLLGLTAPFSGPSKELGRAVKLGIDTYFQEVNDQSGIAGRKLSLIALDDGYEPDRAAANMVELKEKHRVLGVIGNVGTATAEKTLPYAIEHRLLFFAACTGASFLRNSPPDRYVFNFRASYGEETAAIARYLVETKSIRPEEIAVFAQEDGYGDAGFNGVARALRRYGRDVARIVRAGHQRNSTDVETAVTTMKHHPEIRALIMVTRYKTAPRFIQRMRDEKYSGIFTNVSDVGCVPLAEELSALGQSYANGVIVTQVVPPIDSQSSAVLRFRRSLARFSGTEQPSSTALESYLDARLLVEGLRRAGDQLTIDTLVTALESIRGFDMGTGAPISFGPSEHQASHKVWGMVLDSAGRYHHLELD